MVVIFFWPFISNFIWQLLRMGFRDFYGNSTLILKFKFIIQIISNGLFSNVYLFLTE